MVADDRRNAIVHEGVGRVPCRRTSSRVLGSPAPDRRRGSLARCREYEALIVQKDAALGAILQMLYGLALDARQAVIAQQAIDACRRALEAK